MLQSQNLQLRNLFRALILIFLSVASLILCTYFVLNFQTALIEGGALKLC